MNGLQLREAPRAQRRDPDIDPRILARLMSVRQERWQRRWRGLTVVLGVITIAAGAWLVAQSSLLAVHHVKVVPGPHTSRESVLAASGLSGRHQMLSVRSGAIRRRVAALPWVAQVSVVRRWPTTVTIRITERVPLAQVPGVPPGGNNPAGQAAVVDGAARVLATGSEAAGLLGGTLRGLPVITGAAPAGGAGSTLASADTPALALLEALARIGFGGAPGASPGAARRVTAVQLSGDGTLGATLSPGPVSVVFGSLDGLGAKVADLRSLLAQVPAGVSVTIDVRVIDAPVLTNEKIGTMVSTTQRG